MPPSSGLLLGIDFTSTPSRRKPITVARGQRVGSVVRLEALQELPTWGEFEALLLQPGPWLAGCDFPFGLPRTFVESLQLGDHADAIVAEIHRRCPSRMDFRALVDAWGSTRAPGQRLLHRVTDQAVPGISSTSPLQTRYVPVGFMYYEGFSRLVRANVTAPALRQGDPSRVALESYPGLLAHELLGRRSYKNDSSTERLIARKDMVDALEQGRTQLGLRLKLSHPQREALVDDASGDHLDAALCLVQAAWASMQPRYGLPAGVDPVEGWIATAAGSGAGR